MLNDMYFTVPGKPQGKGRPRFTRGGHTYTPPATKKYEDHLKKQFLAALEEEGDAWNKEGIYALSITACFPIPKSWNKLAKHNAQRGATACTALPDLDNIAKAVMDALNGAAWDDDRQVVNLEISREWEVELNREGRLAIIIEEISDTLPGEQ